MNNGFNHKTGAALTEADAGRRGVERVLLVEDSMLIALDAEETLVQAGIEDVAIVGSVAAALKEIDKGMPDFALLDFNLGNETSEAVAEVLAEAGVPFCFATGYGDALERMTLSPPCGVLTKPYSRDDIIGAIDKAGGLSAKH